MKQGQKILSNDGKQILSARVAASRLSCAQDYIGKLCREGKLSGTQVNGMWFVFEDSLTSFEVLRQRSRAARSLELSLLRRQELSNNGCAVKSDASATALVVSPLLVKISAASIAVGFIFVVSVALVKVLPAMSDMPLSASLGTLQSPFFAQQQMRFPLPSLAQFGNVFEWLFASRVSFEAKPAEPTVRPQEEPFPAAATAAVADNGVISAALSASSSKIQYAVYPVVERTIERVVVENGISQELLTSIVRELAAGNNGSIQYNNNGYFAASSTALVWDNTQGSFSVSGAVNADTLCLRGVCLTKTQLQNLLSATATSTP